MAGSEVATHGRFWVATEDGIWIASHFPPGLTSDTPTGATVGSITLPPTRPVVETDGMSPAVWYRRMAQPLPKK